MKSLFYALFLTGSVLIGQAAPAAPKPDAQRPLRVFIRAGVKTHGPGQHDHPRFLTEWRQLLSERGAQADGGMEFPTAAQLQNSDVLVLYAQEGASLPPADRAALDAFLQRGGGLVVIHDAACGTDPHWFKTVAGGAWEHQHSKWLEGDVGIYILDQNHPITRGLSNFDLKDEIYYDLHFMPEAKILASSFHSAFTIAPQMWVYEKEKYRAFVCLQGHEFTTFQLPHFRALLLRGMAWVARRDADLLVNPTELASLRYPPGGPTAPEKAAEKIRLSPGFSINLVAAEPLIEKPISLDWDAQGRLWVAETPEYPNGRRLNKNDEMVALWRQENPQAYSGATEQRPARDRISILSDSDGDGRMDKKEVFYDGLELVTSLVLYRDGVIVAQPPEVLWLRDTNHDGKADRKEVLFTGFGTFDTHAVLSNLRWGLDGWVYGTEGYSGAEPKSADGQRSFGKLGAGVLRFKPDGSQIEMVSSKGGNTWGMDFAWDGEVFFTQANGTHLQHVVLPESVLSRGRVGSTASYKTIEDHRKVFPAVQQTRHPYLQIDNVGGFTAASGSTCYTGGAWPEEYNYTHFVSEPTVNLVHLDSVKPVSSSFNALRERPEGEFIASTDLWFRPIHQRVGPDGALYIIDFYNQAAVHNDTRGPKHGAGNAAVRPDRDHHFGRIWRVQHNEAKRLSLPKLAGATPAELAAALDHPNGWVRETAQRLLTENQVPPAAVNPLLALARSTKPAYGRLRALWALDQAGAAGQVLEMAMKDSSPAIRKNALQIAAQSAAPGEKLYEAVTARLRDDDPRTRLQAVLALGPFMARADAPSLLVKTYPSLDDPWSQSAAVSVAADAPLATLQAALRAESSIRLGGLVSEISKLLVAKSPPRDSAQALIAVAAAPPEKNPLRAVILNALAATTGAPPPPWSPEIEGAFRELLKEETSRELSGGALALAARWDTQQRLRREIQPFIARSLAQLSDPALSQTDRARSLENLLPAYRFDAQIIPAVVGLVSSGDQGLARQAIAALGEIPDKTIAAELVATYPRVEPAIQEMLFNQLIRRTDWTGQLLDALNDRKISPLTLGPASLHRLRTHANRETAQRANQILDQIRGPEMKEKNELIAKFSPLVGQPGNAQSGRKLFSDNCAACHKFNGEGRDLAPDLTGMGVHGPLELLVHILDPNRVVEGNYVGNSIETRDDQVLDGIIARENNAGLLLRNAAGDFEVKRENIKSQRSTGLSLMPNGFESLGPEGLRDILAYLGTGEARFRTVDLGGAFTASTARGLYASEEAKDQSLQFKRFGLVKAGEIPFEVSSPARHPEARNVVVLRGGSGFARTLPAKVEIPVGLALSKLHFLSGVGGWAYPWGEASGHKVPVLKVTLVHENNRREEFVYRNGVEFADYIGNADVPGSRAVPDLVRNGQIRYFSAKVEEASPVRTILMESYENHVAPTVVAITAELRDAGAHTTGVSSPTPQLAAAEIPAGTARALAADSPGAVGRLRVLIVGGGSSHDFQKWFNEADSKTLSKMGNTSVQYTEAIESILPRLPQTDVLLLSNNQPMTNSALREAIFRFVKEGKGLLLVHPAAWYNWKDWPEYNQLLVGGGTKAHDKYGEFEVKVTDPLHPVMKGVSGSFKITDELYHFVKDAHGSPIKVLATAQVPGRDTTYPIAWTVQMEKGRIVCLTLGHDGAAHQHPDYQRILENAVKWTGEKIQ